MYLPPVPILDEIFSEDADGRVTITTVADAELIEPFPNFYPGQSRSNIKTFVSHVISVLLFQDVAKVLRPVCSFKHIGKFLFRLGDIVLNWGFYLIQIIFPLYLVVNFVEVVYNIM